MTLTYPFRASLSDYFYAIISYPHSPWGCRAISSTEYSIIISKYFKHKHS